MIWLNQNGFKKFSNQIIIKLLMLILRLSATKKYKQNKKP